MHLSKYTDYSFRVLMYLAVHQDRLVTISEVSQAYSVSKNHMVKIVHHLALAGMIHSVPGKKGGIQLGREPKKINLLDVIEITETNFDLSECFTESGFCPIQNHCRLTKVFTEALFGFFKVMRSYTLGDLIRSGEFKSQLRGLHDPPDPIHMRKSKDIQALESSGSRMVSQKAPNRKSTQKSPAPKKAS